MKPDKINRFVQELKRRRVFRGIVVYGATTLVLLEAATNLAQSFGRESAPRWFVVLLGVGFFGSLWFSWVYDFTPGGIRKTDPESPKKVPIPNKEIRIYQTTTFISVLLIIGFISYHIITDPKANHIKSLEKSIAVLPFQDPSLSPVQARIYEFVGQELTSCLVKVKDYKIVPWEDCRTYMRRNKELSQVGEDLRVCILLLWRPYETGKNRQLSIELISAKDADLILSETYPINGPWAEEVRRLSSKISKKITRKLRIYTTPQERALMGEQKVSAQASLYASLGDAYTQDAWTRSETGNYGSGEREAFTDSISFGKAIEYYSEAINEDPAFAEAYANRAKAKLMGIQARFFDRSVLDESRADIEHAFDLEEDLPEAHVAMGFYYYYGIREYELAAVSFEKACELRPNYTEYLFYLSKIYATLGNWREVRVLSDKVFESNSQNALYYNNLGLSYQYLNEPSKADLSFDRAINSLPGWYASYINKAICQTFRGQIAEARATLIEATENSGKSFNRFLAELYLYEGNYVSAAQQIEYATDQEFKDLEESQGVAFLIKAKIHTYAGHSDLARENFGLAASYFEEQLKENPEDYFAHSRLGIVYAGLGNKQKAVEHGQKAVLLGSQNYSAVGFPYILYDMAVTYTKCNDNDSAISTLNELLNTHSLFTIDYIKIDPDFYPLLNQPGFKDLNP